MVDLPTFFTGPDAATILFAALAGVAAATLVALQRGKKLRGELAAAEHLADTRAERVTLLHGRVTRLQQQLGGDKVSPDADVVEGAGEATADVDVEESRPASRERGAVCGAWDLIGGRLYVCALPPDGHDLHRTPRYARPQPDGSVRTFPLTVEYAWSASYVDDLHREVAVLQAALASAATGPRVDVDATARSAGRDG